MAEFVEVMRQWERLCATQNRCFECPMYHCRSRAMQNPDDFEESIMDWAAKHPEKTMKDVLLEKFPKAKLRDNGTPFTCPHYLGFPAMSKVCVCPSQCAECWNRPAPEE